jgi:hypothetical protein
MTLVEELLSLADTALMTREFDGHPANDRLSLFFACSVSVGQFALRTCVAYVVVVLTRVARA